MAEGKSEHDEELEPSQFCCSVCLDLPKDPVGIPCGHSYCKGCIEGFWDQNEEKGSCTCPQCRETFNLRPVLTRNHELAEVVEMLKRKGTQQTPPSLPEAAAADSGASSGPGGVVCDFCSETDARKATMSCLTCVASYCPVHLEPHYSIRVLKMHQLVSATVPLQEKMCTKHNKLMEVYCRTDRKCICYLCVIDEHHGHKTVSTAAERTEQQKQLTVTQKKVQQRGKEREKELTALLEALKDFKTAVETSNEIFDELISFLKKMRATAEQLILAQEKTAVAQAEGLQLQLEEEITKLKQRDTELEQISHVDDHIHFIQTLQSPSASCESPDLPGGLVVLSKHTFREVTDCISEVKDDMEGLLMQRWPSITSTASAVNVLQQHEAKSREEFLRLSSINLPVISQPKTREEFLRLSSIYLPVISQPMTREEFLYYSRPLKLDVNSISENMLLSGKKLRVTVQDGYYVSSSRRAMMKYEQVWCCEALTQRCYWEVVLYGHTWCVAVSHKDTNETFQPEFGRDNRSWSLESSSRGCNFRHDNQSRRVSGLFYSTIGVYLDYLEGTLSFYGVSGSTMTLLHRVENTFTEPLYPCVGFKDGSQKGKAYSAQLVKIW